eukprot:5352905-Prymnesium_polylepis.1
MCIRDRHNPCRSACKSFHRSDHPRCGSRCTFAVMMSERAPGCSKARVRSATHLPQWGHALASRR